MTVLMAIGRMIQSSAYTSNIRGVGISELATWKRECQNEMSHSIHTSHRNSKRVSFNEMQ
jgi:hypothetical protein